jgi:hypothetical protein
VAADLSGVHAKLQRADEHYRAFMRAVSDYEANTEYQVIIQPDPTDATQRRFYIGLNYSREIPGLRWGALVGDMLNCYRSALDHLVYALAVHYSASGVPQKERALQFPICDDHDRWKAFNWRIAELPRHVQAEIERVQPYIGRKAGSLSGLILLRELNDQDKHRLVQVAAIAHGQTTVHVLRGFGVPSLEFREGPIEPNTPFARLTMSLPNPASVDVKVETYTLLAFALGVQVPAWYGGGIKYLATNTAGAIRRATKQVVGELERLAR